MLKLADWTLRFHNPECILDIFIRKLTVLKIILHKNKEKKKQRLLTTSITINCISSQIFSPA